MGLTNAQKEQLLAEVWDERKVQLVCERHPGYGGPPAKPVSGCKSCWQVYWWRTLVKMPPDERKEWLAKIYETLRYMVELVEKGQWDYSPFAHPEITFTKEKVN